MRKGNLLSIAIAAAFAPRLSIKDLKPGDKVKLPGEEIERTIVDVDDAVEAVAEKIVQEVYGSQEFRDLVDTRNEKPTLPRGYRKSKMRNAPCLCGSGVKFKNCCIDNFA